MQALLIGMAIPCDSQADHVAVLGKALGEITVNISRQALTSRRTLRARIGGLRLLDNLINGNRNAIATEILRPL